MPPPAVTVTGNAFAVVMLNEEGVTVIDGVINVWLTCTVTNPELPAKYGPPYTNPVPIGRGYRIRAHWQRRRRAGGLASGQSARLAPGVRAPAHIAGHAGADPGRDGSGEGDGGIAADGAGGRGHLCARQHAVPVREQVGHVDGAEAAGVVPAGAGRVYVLKGAVGNRQRAIDRSGVRIILQP